MAENTTVGPAGSNHAAMPVTGHDTYGHLDDNADGAFTGGSNTTGEAGPVTSGHDFSAHGHGGVEPGNDSLSPAGPLQPTH